MRISDATSQCFYPHVVTVLDIIFIPMRVAIVMELVPDGDLFAYVRRSRVGLPEDTVCQALLFIPSWLLLVAERASRD